VPATPTYSLLIPTSPVPVGGSAKRCAFRGMTVVARTEAKGEYGRQEARWDYVAQCVPPIFPSPAMSARAPFRHTSTCPWPRPTATVWRNLQQNGSRPLPPLKGLREPRAASVSYGASVPAGHAGGGVASSYRALSPYGET